MVAIISWRQRQTKDPAKEFRLTYTSQWISILVRESKLRELMQVMLSHQNGRIVELVILLFPETEMYYSEIIQFRKSYHADYI